MTNRFAGIGLGLGVFLITGAIVASVYSAKPSQQAFVVPGPVVILTERGPIMGAGLSGIAF